MTDARPRGGLRISDLLNPPSSPPPSSSSPPPPSPHQPSPLPPPPQTSTSNTTPSKCNKEKDRRSARLTRAEKAEIRALRAWGNLTYSQIAALTSYTHRQVQYACTGPLVTGTPGTPGTTLPRKRRKKREKMMMVKGKK